MKVIKDNFRWSVKIDDRVIYLQLRDFTKLRNFNYIMVALFVVVSNIILTTIFGLISQGDNYFIVSLTVSVVLAVIFYYLYEAYGAPVVREVYMGVKSDERLLKITSLKDLLNGVKTIDVLKYEKIIKTLNCDNVDATLQELFSNERVNKMVIHSGSTRLDLNTVDENEREFKSTGEGKASSVNTKDDDFITLPNNKIKITDRDDITLEEFEKINGGNNKINSSGGVYIRGSIVSDADKKRLSSLNGELSDYSRKFNGLIIKNQSLTHVIDKLKILGRNYLYMSKTNKSLYLEIFDETLNLFNIMENSGVGTTVDHVDEVKWRENFNKLSTALTKLEGEHYEELNERLTEQNSRIDKIFKIK